MCTTNAVSATASAHMPSMRLVDSTPRRPSSSISATAAGSVAAIPTARMSEMPLPMPRAVIRPASQTRKITPPVKVSVVVRRNIMPGSGTTLGTPSRASAMPSA